jgi:signal transduction histidine kinase
VDYLFKPLQAKILASKVNVFALLYKQKRHLEQTSLELEAKIKEIKAKDEQLWQKQKMELMGKLVGGVAHEINNPLSFMLSHLRRVLKKNNLLLKDLRSADVEDMELSWHYIIDNLNQMNRSLNVAVDGGYRIASIVKDLSSFARSDLSESMSAIDVNEVVKKVLNLAKYDINAKARLVEDLNRVDKVSIGEGRLFQVVLNLIMNAIYAVEKVNAKDHEILVKSWMSKNIVNIEIKDSGCGIAPENLDKIFDPFFTTKPPGDGQGLGLATCYGIVKAHKGKIEVSSSPGKGTSVIVSLPVSESVRSVSDKLHI